MRNPRIHFGLYNTSVSNVPREMFSNTQRVRNVTAEVRESDTRTLHNPSSGYEPGVPGQQFLMKLRLTGSYLTCDCAIGYDHCLCFSLDFRRDALDVTTLFIVDGSSYGRGNIDSIGRTDALATTSPGILGAKRATSSSAGTTAGTTTSERRSA